LFKVLPAKTEKLAKGCRQFGAFLRLTVEHTLHGSPAGAFNHSPLRKPIFGSRSAELLRSAKFPTLLLR